MRVVKRSWLIVVDECTTNNCTTMSRRVCKIGGIYGIIKHRWRWFDDGFYEHDEELTIVGVIF